MPTADRAPRREAVPPEHRPGGVARELRADRAGGAEAFIRGSPHRSSSTALVVELASGLVLALNADAEMGFESFNLAVDGAPPGIDTHPLDLRVARRSNLMRSTIGFDLPQRRHWEARSILAGDGGGRIGRRFARDRSAGAAMLARPAPTSRAAPEEEAIRSVDRSDPHNTFVLVGNFRLLRQPAPASDRGDRPRITVPRSRRAVGGSGSERATHRNRCDRRRNFQPSTSGRFRDSGSGSDVDHVRERKRTGAEHRKWLAKSPVGTRTWPGGARTSPLPRSTAIAFYKFQNVAVIVREFTDAPELVRDHR